jgi:hypothetical protein
MKFLIRLILDIVVILLCPYINQLCIYVLSPAGHLSLLLKTNSVALLQFLIL